MEHVRIFDTTLRDGEQSAGATMTLDEKIKIARKLEELGVDVIEAGFPAASPGELDAVRQIATAITKSEVAALCRTREKDILAAWEAIGQAKQPLLHVFIATSALHLEFKLKMTQAQVLEEIRRGVSMCRSLCPRVEFSAEDSTRTELSFLREAIACAVENGATSVNIPDTVGYTMPDEYKNIISEVVKIATPKGVIVSSHCHDDLGLAVANSLAAISAGARQIECCVNGIGERAGNAALEEVVMALKTRSDLTNCTTRVDTRHLVSVSRMVSDATGMLVQPNKAIVGKNAFAHEAGIHQHGVLKEKRTYEIMRPEDVGFTESSLVLGKHSGRHALADRLRSLGYDLDESHLERVFHAFKALADKKKRIYDEDLHTLIGNDVYQIAKRYELQHVEFKGSTGQSPWALIKMVVDGQNKTAEGLGDGPVSAAMEAIRRCTGKDNVTLEHYSLSAITNGADAQGRVHLTIAEGELAARGQSTHTDVVVASATAFVHALNHLVYQEEVLKRRRAEGHTGITATPEATARKAS